MCLIEHAKKKAMEKEKAIKITKALAEELNICFHWINEFNKIFPEENLQYELYNETAPNFFSNLSKLYFDYFFLKISRMLDPAVINNYKNLSLYQLIEIAKEVFPNKKNEIKDEINLIKKEASTILTARNKLISHKDLNVTLNNDNLGKTEFADIESITLKMSKVINKILELLGEPQYSFVWLIDIHGASSLIQSLKQSSYYNDLCLDPELYNKIEKVERESKYNKL
jgi:hypothetical protein